METAIHDKKREPRLNIGETWWKGISSVLIGAPRNRRLMMFISPIVALGVWQLLSSLGIISVNTFTSPFKAFLALKEIALDENAALSGTLFDHVSASLQEVILGFLIAAAIGVPLGLLMGWSRIAFNILDPLVELLRPIPPTAWVALSLLFFGLGLQQKIFVVVVATVSPILITTIDGVRSIDSIYLKVARTHNASQMATIMKVVVPAMLPSILTSFRVGLGMSWMVVVAAELIAAEAGLGFLLMQSYRIFRLDLMIAVMFMIGFLAFMTDRALRALQRRLLAWEEFTA